MEGPRRGALEGAGENGAGVKFPPVRISRPTRQGEGGRITKCLTRFELDNPPPRRSNRGKRGVFIGVERGQASVLPVKKRGVAIWRGATLPALHTPPPAQNARGWVVRLAGMTPDAARPG